MNTDDLRREFSTLSVRANGAALTVSVVAASSLFSGGKASFQPEFLVPAWIFLAGIVLGYVLITVIARHASNGDALDTIAGFRKTQMECETSPNPSEKMVEIGEDCRRRADDLEAKLMTDTQLAELERAMNWLNNLSLGCFAIGVATALVMLGQGSDHGAALIGSAMICAPIDRPTLEQPPQRHQNGSIPSRCVAHSALL